MFSDQKFFLNEFVFGPINFTYFDKTLKECFWEHLEQIPTIKVTFVQTIFFLWTICPYLEYLISYWHDVEQT